MLAPNRTIYEYDWDGNVVWTHEGIGSVNDMRVLPNNNRLLIAHEPIPEEFQRQVRDVEIAPWWGPRLRGSGETQLGADLYEVNLDGEVVWEWHAHNHLDLNCSHRLLQKAIGCMSIRLPLCPRTSGMMPVTRGSDPATFCSTRGTSTPYTSSTKRPRRSSGKVPMTTRVAWPMPTRRK